ncbi:hypothetical protein [Yinghuangia seranimata]|uniref:hypothetical protein n=1 Tax=Yinghuangia seranimata TaxID=408067 RepID=UPI00248C1C04|nr:hypothetical protein [Yinghuangia seranimata]MDI2129112.1 hypothetical protein [Yinghuangia seranimata]
MNEIARSTSSIGARTVARTTARVLLGTVATAAALTAAAGSAQAVAVVNPDLGGLPATASDIASTNLLQPTKAPQAAAQPGGEDVSADVALPGVAD